MSATETVRLCRGTWCWLGWETGYRLRGWLVYCTPWFPPACGAQSSGLRAILFVSQAFPQRTSSAGDICDSSVTKGQVKAWCALNSTNGIFFPVCFGQPAKNGEKDAGSGGGPTDRQPETDQQTGIQQVKWTLWKPNPQRIHRETNSWSWTQADFGSMLHTGVNKTLL